MICVFYLFGYGLFFCCFFWLFAYWLLVCGYFGLIFVVAVCCYFALLCLSVIYCLLIGWRFVFRFSFYVVCVVCNGMVVSLCLVVFIGWVTLILFVCRLIAEYIYYSLFVVLLHLQRLLWVVFGVF